MTLENLEIKRAIVPVEVTPETSTFNAETLLQSNELADYLTMSPVQAHLAGLAKSGRTTRYYFLKNLALRLSNGEHDEVSFPWHELQYEHIMALRLYLAENYSLGTANFYLITIKSLFRELRRRRQITTEHFEAIMEIPRIKGGSELPGRALQTREIELLLSACLKDTRPYGVRDAVLIAVMYATGVRKSELVNLKLEDYNPDTEELIIRKGKGNKDRVVFLHGAFAQYLARWLELRGTQPGFIFHPIHNLSGKIYTDFTTVQKSEERHSRQS